MITITTTIMHPTTGEIIRTIREIESVELDGNHVTYADDDRYCVACFVHGIRDVSVHEIISDGIDYLECYACKARMEFKEVPY